MESGEAYQEEQSSPIKLTPDKSAVLDEPSPHDAQIDDYPPIEPLPQSFLDDLSEVQSLSGASISDSHEVTTPRLKVVIASEASSSSGSSNPPDIISRIDYQILNLLTGCQQAFNGLGSSSIVDDLAKMISDDIEAKLQLIRNRLKSFDAIKMICGFLEILRSRALEKKLNVQDLDDLKANIDAINSIRRLAVISWRHTIEKNLETYDPDDTEVKTIQDLLSELDDDKPIELWCAHLTIASKKFQEINRRKSQDENLIFCNRDVEEEVTAFESKVYKEILMNDMTAIKDLILLKDDDGFVIFNKSITLFYKIYAIHSLVSLIFSPSKHLLTLPYVNADFLDYFIRLFDKSEWVCLKAYHQKLSHLIEFEEKYVVDLKTKVAIGEKAIHEGGKITDATDDSDKYNTKCSEAFRQALHWCFQLHPDDDGIDPASSKAKIYQEMPTADRERYELIYNSLFEAYLELINGTDADSLVSREELISALRQIIHYVREKAQETTPSAQLYATLLYQQSKPLSAIWDEEKKQGRSQKTPLMESLLNVYVPVVEQLLLEPPSLTLSIDSSPVSASKAMPHDLSGSTHQRHTVPAMTSTSSQSKTRGSRSLSLFGLPLSLGKVSSSSSSSAPNSPLSPRASQLPISPRKAPLSPREVPESTTYTDLRPLLPSTPPNSPRTSWFDSLKRGTHSNSSPSLPTSSPSMGTPPPSPRSPRPNSSISTLFAEMVGGFRQLVEPSEKDLSSEPPDRPLAEIPHKG